MKTLEVIKKEIASIKKTRNLKKRIQLAQSAGFEYIETNPKYFDPGFEYIPFHCSMDWNKTFGYIKVKK